MPRPTAPEAQAHTKQQLEELEAQLSQTDTLRRIEAERRQKTEAELAAARAEIDAIRQANAAATDPHDYNEAETRRLLIDVLLREAGWDPSAPNATEVEVQGMPIQKVGDTGRGFVDYVLWGDNGKPLALVEAKRARKDPRVGQRPDPVEGVRGRPQRADDLRVSHGAGYEKTGQKARRYSRQRDSSVTVSHTSARESGRRVVPVVQRGGQGAGGLSTTEDRPWETGGE